MPGLRAQLEGCESAELCGRVLRPLRPSNYCAVLVRHSCGDGCYNSTAVWDAAQRRFDSLGGLFIEYDPPRDEIAAHRPLERESAPIDVGLVRTTRGVNAHFIPVDFNQEPGRDEPLLVRCGLRPTCKPMSHNVPYDKCGLGFEVPICLSAKLLVFTRGQGGAEGRTT